MLGHAPGASAQLPSAQITLLVPASEAPHDFREGQSKIDSTHRPSPHLNSPELQFWNTETLPQSDVLAAHETPSSQMDVPGGHTGIEGQSVAEGAQLGKADPSTLWQLTVPAGQTKFFSMHSASSFTQIPLAQRVMPVTEQGHAEEFETHPTPAQWTGADEGQRVTPPPQLLYDDTHVPDVGSSLHLYGVFPDVSEAQVTGLTVTFVW
mmetsp:Transcript_10156/g.18497  ORF Transcript_10156/g.18497 Transcript_10156/m.18497 type:complete len:208 (-) Transcript_10156:6292-6915(-)